MDRTVLKSKHLNQKYKERRELKEVQDRSRKEEKILLIQRKLQKAEELKQQQILKKVAKAHDEESKKSEIHFINKMDAENKRHDILEKEKDSEKRLQDIEEERQRRLEEKAARESAVEERRKAIEAERQQRIDHIRRKREEKDKKIELQMQEKEKERLEAANQKARERELKLFAIEAAHQANVEELQKKILLKQEESKRRHEENIGQIRARAFELSVRRGSSMVGSDHAPALSPYRVKKMCSLCNLIIGSEVYLYSHLRSKKHQEAIQGLLDGVEPSKDQLECYNLKYIVDATNMADSCSVDVKVDKETLKAINKTRKKLRQRLLVKGRILEENWKNGDASIEINSPNKQTLHKIMSKIQSLAKENSPKSPWSGNDALALERLLNQLIKLVSLKNKQDLEYIFRTGAVPVFISFLCPLLELSNDKSPLLPEKIYALLCTILKEICANHLEICYYLLSSTFIISLLDLLALRLTLFSEESATVMSSSFSSPTLPSSNASVRTFDPVCSSLSILLSTIIRTLSDHAFVPWNDNPESFRQRVSDMISYSISIGIVDKLSLCIANSQGLVNSEQDLARQLRNSLSFIVCLTMLLASIKNFGDLFSQIEPEDNTQFIITLRMTHMVGVIPLMYGALLNTGSTLRPQSPTPESPEHVLELALESLQLLNYFALLDLKMLQTILGSEGLSLQLRHIANYLIWYCTHWEADSLLHEVILLIGFFTVDNVDNQNIVHTGQRPTILEQLCSLPYEFFSGSNLSRILLPTLISCCYENEVNCQILEQEVSSTILSSFIDKEIINNQVKATLKRKSLENLIESRVTNDRWSLKLRFPKNKWLSAKKYFEK